MNRPYMIELAFDDFDPAKHPRGQPENAGEFASVPGGGENNGGEAKAPPKFELEPKAVNVGGDKWNRDTAIRLETEYRSEKGDLDQLADKLVHTEPKKFPIRWEDVDEPTAFATKVRYNEYNYPDAYEEAVRRWRGSKETMSQAMKDEQELYKKSSFGFENLVTTAIADRPDICVSSNGILKLKTEDMGKLASNIDLERHDGPLPDFKSLAEMEKSGKSIGDAYKSSPDGGCYYSVSVKDDRFDSDLKTKIANAVLEAFSSQSASSVIYMKPPKSVADDAYRYLSDSWDKSSNSFKMDFAKNHNIVEGEDYRPVIIPEHIDPLNTTDGNDYGKTQFLAKRMFGARTMDVIKQRGIKPKQDYDSNGKVVPGREEVSSAAIQSADGNLWNAWKGSSTSKDGLVIQLAFAREMGGYLRPETLTDAGETEEELKEYADEEFRDIGGFEGVKAMMRAKWETTQWLLDKAGVHDLKLYRGVDMPDVVIKPKGATQADYRRKMSALIDRMPGISDYVVFNSRDIGEEMALAMRTLKGGIVAKPGETLKYSDVPEVMFRKEFNENAKNYLAADKLKEIVDDVGKIPYKDIVAEMDSVPTSNSPDAPGYSREVKGPRDIVYYFMPNLSVKRNGAASTSTDRDVANSWDGTEGRVVLRAHVPRTAALSIPCYGINVHSEHEVVIGGTAWTGWDAWRGKAPDFEHVALGGEPVVSAPKYSKADIERVKAALPISASSYIKTLIDKMKPDITPAQYSDMEKIYKDKKNQEGYEVVKEVYSASADPTEIVAAAAKMFSAGTISKAQYEELNAIAKSKEGGQGAKV